MVKNYQMAKSFLLKNKALALLAIFFVISRLWQFGTIPGGLNQDEASIGYEAYSLWVSGADRHGISWPVHFISWGSGQNALYAWLAIPFIALFDLSVFTLRLPAFALSLLTFVTLYLSFPKSKFGDLRLWVILIFTFNPWSFMVSRWALESNALPPIILLSFYFFSKSHDKLKDLYLGSFFLGLTVYAYGTAYLWAPLFLIAVLLIKKAQGLSCKLIFKSGLVSAIVVSPIVFFLLINALEWPTKQFLGLSFPRYTGTARYNTISNIFSENLIQTFSKNLKMTIDLVIGSQNDGLPWNNIAAYGTLFLWALPFIMGGLFLLIRKGLDKENIQARLMLLGWIGVSLITAGFTEPNINRINHIWLPCVILIATVLNEVYKRKKNLSYVISLAFVIPFFFFFQNYKQSWNDEISRSFFKGYGESYLLAKAEQKQDEIIYSTSKLNMPYIYTLFFGQIPPKDYYQSVEFYNPGGSFQNVKSYKGHQFSLGINERNMGRLFVAHRSEMGLFSPRKFAAEFNEDFVFIKRREQELESGLAFDFSELKGQQDYGTLGINGPVNSNYQGFLIDGKSYSEGFGAHGKSIYSIRLKNFDKKIRYGLSDQSNCGDGVAFQILIDQIPLMKWDTLKNRQVGEVELRLKDEAEVVFKTEALNSNHCDHANWILIDSK